MRFCISATMVENSNSSSTIDESSRDCNMTDENTPQYMKYLDLDPQSMALLGMDQFGNIMDESVVNLIARQVELEVATVRHASCMLFYKIYTDKVHHHSFVCVFNSSWFIYLGYFFAASGNRNLRLLLPQNYPVNIFMVMIAFQESQQPQCQPQPQTQSQPRLIHSDKRKRKSEVFHSIEAHHDETAKSVNNSEYMVDFLPICHSRYPSRSPSLPSPSPFNPITQVATNTHYASGIFIQSLYETYQPSLKAKLLGNTSDDMNGYTIKCFYRSTKAVYNVLLTVWARYGLISYSPKLIATIIRPLMYTDFRFE